MKNCPYCGTTLKPGVGECSECGRAFSTKKKSQDEDKGALVSLDRYEKTQIPAWVMYLVIAIMVGGIVLIFVAKR